jgi:hypothetical protein
VNEELLGRVDSPDVVPELSRFNIEFNVEPQPLAGRGLEILESELDRTWKSCDRIAVGMGASVVAIGTLPTVTEQLLTLRYISRSLRYQALNEQVLRLRQGRPIRLEIDGRERDFGERFGAEFYLVVGRVIRNDVGIGNNGRFRKSNPGPISFPLCNHPFINRLAREINAKRVSGRGLNWRRIRERDCVAFYGKISEHAKRVEWKQHNLGDEIERLGLGLFQGASNLVFEEFGYGPKNGADDRADDWHIPPQATFRASIDAAFEVHIAAVLEPHAGGADVEVIGMDDRIGDNEAAGRGGGAAIAHTRINAIENGRKNAEDREIPDEAVAQCRIAVTLENMIVGGVGIRDVQRAGQKTLEMIRAGGQGAILAPA